VGACALMLLLIALPGTGQSQSDAQLSAQLKVHLRVMKKDQQVLRFLRTHRWLLSDARFKAEAQRQLRIHTASLARMQREAVIAKKAIARRTQARRLASLRVASPKVAICRVFGSYCGQALAVSRCESGLRTTAQNGQYLGLFQMGTSERRIYGHGPTALQQAKAAHAYFVDSGRTWDPWSCKPWS
jgi:hypothetical protein